MSSSETLWLPPSLVRTADLAPVSGAWALPEFGGPAAVAEPVDASYETGYAEGVRDGAARATAQLQPALQVLQGVARELQARHGELLAGRQRDLEALALAVARRLVQREVQADPALLGEWIRRALELMPHDLAVDVRLHPDDLAAFGAARDTLLPSDAGVAIRWIADPSVGRAGFAVESPQRLVDGRLDMALRALYERLGQD